MLTCQDDKILDRLQKTERRFHKAGRVFHFTTASIVQCNAMEVGIGPEVTCACGEKFRQLLLLRIHRTGNNCPINTGTTDPTE